MAPTKAAYYGTKPPLQDATPAAAVADLGALTAANAAGETPTDDEFNAVVTDLGTLRSKINELLGKLRDAKLLEDS